MIVDGVWKHVLERRMRFSSDEDTRESCKYSLMLEV